MHQMHVKSIAAVGALVLLAGCGGGATSALPTAANPAAHKTAAQFTITIPQKSQTLGKARPKFISPSTQSAVITLISVNGVPYTGTASSPATVASNFTPASSNCVAVAGNLVCEATATSIPGNDQYTVALYDAQQASLSPATPAGNLLSQIALTLPVTPGLTNTASLTLNGVATSFAIAFASNDAVTGSQANGFAIVGNAPRTFTVTPLDADNNMIVGPGTPAFTVTSSSPAISIAPTASPGMFTATVSNFSLNPVTLTVSGSGPNGVVTTTVPLTTQTELWVGADATSGVTDGVEGFNPAGQQLVAEDTIPQTVVGSQIGLSVAPNGNLVAAGQLGPPLVNEVAPGTQTPLYTLTGSNTGLTPLADAVIDSNGNLYTGSVSPPLISKFAIGSQVGTLNLSPSHTTSTGAFQLALAGTTLWAGSFTVNSVVAVDTTSLFVTTTISSTAFSTPEGVAVDAAGNLWVANAGNNTIVEFSAASIAPGGSLTLNTPISTLSSPALLTPTQLAFDPSGNLWVVNDGTKSVVEFSVDLLPGGGTIPVANVIAPAGLSPFGIAFTP